MQNRTLVTLILENFVFEGKAFWNTKYLSIIAYLSGKGRFKESPLQELPLWAHLIYKSLSLRPNTRIAKGILLDKEVQVKCLIPLLVKKFQWELLKSS